MAESKWVVWSFEHDAWWAPNERGYVQDLKNAGRYTEAKAVEIERMANRYGPVNERAMSLASAEQLIDGVDDATMMRRVRAVAEDPTRHSPGPVYTSMAREIIRLRAATRQRLSDLWICERCLALLSERDLGATGMDGCGHDIGDDEPHYCGPCVPLDKDELSPLLEELSNFRWEEHRRAKAAATNPATTVRNDLKSGGEPDVG